MESLKEFLETSTIHGLAHISTAKSKIAKVVWFSIVVFCFFYAIRLIHSSFSDWSLSPVATTITTQPIEKFNFPEISICPPRSLANALKYDLMKVSNKTLNQGQKTRMQEQAKELFGKEADASFASSVLNMVNKENVDQIFEGFVNFPKKEEEGYLIEMSVLEGNIRSPGFRETFSQHIYREVMGRQLHYVIDLTGFKDYMAMAPATEKLSINIDTTSPEAVRIATQAKYKMYIDKMVELVTWSDAEAYCVAEGGHLASVTSLEEFDGITDMAMAAYQASNDNSVNDMSMWHLSTVGIWLGATDEEGEWRWTDGTTWGGFDNWKYGHSSKKDGCLKIDVYQRNWYVDSCAAAGRFVCGFREEMPKPLYELSYDQLDSAVHLWYLPQTIPLETMMEEVMPGFEMSWAITNIRDEPILPG